MRRLIVAFLLTIGAAAGAHAQTGCTIQTKAQLLNAMADNTAQYGLTPQVLRNFVCSVTSLGAGGSLGNTTISGTLGVTGATSLSSLGTSGNVGVGGTLGVNGSATFTGASVNLGNWLAPVAPVALPYSPLLTTVLGSSGSPDYTANPALSVEKIGTGNATLGVNPAFSAFAIMTGSDWQDHMTGVLGQAESRGAQPSGSGYEPYIEGGRFQAIANSAMAPNASGVQAEAGTNGTSPYQHLIGIETITQNNYDNPTNTFDPAHYASGITVDCGYAGTSPKNCDVGVYMNIYSSWSGGGQFQRGFLADTNTITSTGTLIEGRGHMAYGLNLQFANGMSAWAVVPNNTPLWQMNAATNAPLNILKLDGSNNLNIAQDAGVAAVHVFQSDWLTPGTATYQLPWPVPGAHASVLSNVGQIALTTASRASDLSNSYGSLQTTIGTASFAMNDDVFATSARHVTVYAGYDEAQTLGGSSGLTYGREIDAVNFASAGTPATPGSPYHYGDTDGLWLASGGQHTGVADATTAITVKNNGAPYQTGIVFGASSITMAGGFGYAMKLAKGHLIQWYDSSDVAGPNITSIVATAANSIGLQFQDGGATFVNAGGHAVASVQQIASAVNGVALTPSIAASPVAITAIGTDTNIELNLTPKGTGAVYTSAPFVAGSFGNTGSTFAVDSSGNTKALTYSVGSNQVVGARQTGWTAMTGTPDISTAFATSTVTTAQLAERVLSLQAALTTHGLIGP